MSNINSFYEGLIDPPELVKNFKSDKEFIDWLRIGTKKDMKCALRAFEIEEMYEYCNLIKEEINNGEES